jgi:tetratricopeptide (TPR) repeat protein
MIPMWRNNLSLWSLLYARHPYSTFAFSQMIASYGIAGDCNRVEKLTESSGMRSAAIDGTVAKCIVDKDPSKAILLVERALAADVYLAASQMTNLLDTLAYAHELLKNYDKSLEILEDIMHAYPDFHPSRIRHIEVLMKACRHNDADLAYNETLSLFSESERAVLPGYQKIWQTEYDTHCPK